MFGAIKTLAAVVPLTILIWAYAEREQIVPQQGIPVRIRLLSGAPDRMARSADVSSRVITVDLEGSRARVERVRSELGSGSDDAVVDVTVPADFPLGKVAPLALRQRIEDAPIFKENGIALTNCTPAYLEVTVDALVSVEARPALRPDVKSRITGNVLFDPPVVTLRGPKAALSDPSHLVVYADIPDSDIPKSAGDHDIPPVPVRLGRSDDTISISPSTVKVRVSVKETNVPYKISSVPVFVRLPSTMEERYRVVFPSGASMSNITVVGPEDQIARLKSEDFRAEATLNILPEDARGQLPRAPTYTLPPDVTVSKEDKNRTIDFRLVDRTAPE